MKVVLARPTASLYIQSRIHFIPALGHLRSVTQCVSILDGNTRTGIITFDTAIGSKTRAPPSTTLGFPFRRAMPAQPTVFAPSGGSGDSSAWRERRHSTNRRPPLDKALTLQHGHEGARQSHIEKRKQNVVRGSLRVHACPFTTDMRIVTVSDRLLKWRACTMCGW